MSIMSTVIGNTYMTIVCLLDPNISLAIFIIK